eukprot:TRINITY_DN8335_c0_g1_i1.p1 TRINITY_DN8335_c0_g1~~TRINITY_DN8335_c0_g1_i1.p1  ORF type:complete len:526 (+),score=75.96 TRINITY_DN8335_c0_g1_i1:18-1595(+)
MARIGQETHDDPRTLEQLLFPSDKCQELVNNVLAQEYLSELTSYGLQQILAEPQRVLKEKQSLDREMQDLSWTNYRTFIDSSKCTQFIKEQVSELCTITPTVQGHLDELSVTCQNTANVSQKLLAKRKENNITLQHHTTILEFLEIPQMMYTCIKNQCYEEALELHQFSRKMVEEHGHIPAIKLIAKEVETIKQSMIKHLHSQLIATNTTLSDAFQVINYLSRLDVYSDYELRMLFLRSREEQMEYTLSLLPPGNNFLSISKMIDTTRAEVQDILNHYFSLFPEDFDQESSSDPSKPNNGGSILIATWGWHISNKFIDRLRLSLRDIQDGTFLANISSSSMFFGKVMARFGCDFRGKLVPIFENVLVRLFCSSLDNADKGFVQNLRKFHDLSAHAGLSAYTPQADEGKDALSAPIILLDYPPIALLTNAVLSTFNDLRTCWLYSIQDSATKHFQKFLKQAILRLFEYKEQHISGKKPEDKELFSKMCIAFSEEVIPYLVKCFNRIFSTSKNLLNVAELQLSLCTL